MHDHDYFTTYCVSVFYTCNDNNVTSVPRIMHCRTIEQRNNHKNLPTKGRFSLVQQSTYCLKNILGR